MNNPNEKKRVYMHRLQTQMPFGFFRGGSEEGPPKTTFSDGLNRFPGHAFFELFDDFYDF